MHKLCILAATMLLQLPALASTTAQVQVQKASAAQLSSGDTQKFTGTVLIARQSKVSAEAQNPSTVQFWPGARTAWYRSHSAQTLLITEGKGVLQQEGERPRLLEQGDLVHIPAGVKLWYGATTTEKMSKIALVPASNSAGKPTSKEVQWLEPVSDLHYHSFVPQG